MYLGLTYTHMSTYVHTLTHATFARLGWEAVEVVQRVGVFVVKISNTHVETGCDLISPNLRVVGFGKRHCLESKAENQRTAPGVLFCLLCEHTCIHAHTHMHTHRPHPRHNEQDEQSTLG